MDAMNTQMIDADTIHPGTTNFDVADRLAIINVCNSYARYYDTANLETWFKLFTDDVKCSVSLSDNEPVIVAGDGFRDMFITFRQSATDHGVTPRHCNTNLAVLQQSADHAVVESYMLYVPLEIALLNVPQETLTKTRLNGTGRYVFNLLKGHDGVWRISDYTITYDQKVVEHSLES